MNTYFFEVNTCFDIFNPFKNEDLKVLLSPDGIHPSTVGHKVIYEKVKDVLAIQVVKILTVM